jgi:hypothetical protein
VKRVVAVCFTDSVHSSPLDERAQSAWWKHMLEVSLAYAPPFTQFYIPGSSELGHQQTTRRCTRETALRRRAVRFRRHARSRGDVLEGHRICFRIRRRADVQRCARCQRKRCRCRWRRCVVVSTAYRVAT